ncbi:septal ring lytic transglycosylase RlpA family protein [Egbenema bharatensis]|uniref:septal ring lytic transglycosylase RlpA family protein n=1 Tax=Egbenema bharatensis TaxID=3463334 RepID=UPI003A8B0819
MNPPSQAVTGQDLANPVLQVVSNLFRWTGDIREAFRFTTPLVTIVPAKNPCLASPDSDHRHWSYTSRHGIRELNVGQCTELWQRDANAPKPADRVFQVRVKDQLVAELPTAERAEELARRLQHALRNSDFEPSHLTPALINGMPAGKVGDTVLFWVDPELAALLDRNPELLAITWINNLRETLDVPPIPLTQAQSQMHRLTPTDQQIQGTASWYGPYFHGRLTATGEIFNQTDLTAAHPTLPFNTYLKVTNLLTGKSLIVRINDRGPYFEDRSLDLSREAARYLDSELTGVVPYEAVIMENEELAQVRSANGLSALSASLTRSSR